MGGMGDNRSDVPSMLLLPELMYRHAFKAPLFKQPQEWPWFADGSPVRLSETDTWGARMAAGFAAPQKPRLQRLASRMVPSFVKSLTRRAPPQPKIRAHPERISLNWMPATAYRPFWHAMPAFALPSFYDGRIRVNLKGREVRGIVERNDYQRVLADVERVVRESIDPATRKSVVDFVEYTAPQDPGELAETQSDLVFVWKGTAASLEHPSLGRIGPVPYRRTGGHTGPSGVAFIRAQNLPAGERGTRSAFDVVPTIIELMGQPRAASLSGGSLLSPPEALHYAAKARIA
jgi:hypothetical protein